MSKTEDPFILPISWYKTLIDCAPVWNGFVNFTIVIDNHRERLTPNQRRAYLVFAFDSSMQNSGHFSALHQVRDDELPELAEAYEWFGGSAHAQVLRKTIALLNEYSLTTEAVSNYEIPDEFGEKIEALDMEYYQADTPAIQKRIEQYVTAHAEEFVRFLPPPKSLLVRSYLRLKAAIHRYKYRRRFENWFKEMGEEAERVAPELK